MTRSEIVGENIRHLRNIKGMTQIDLANAINRSQSVIAMYENGQRLPSTKIIVKIAEVLGVTFGDVWGENNSAGKYDWYSDAFDKRNSYPQTKYDGAISATQVNPRVNASTARTVPDVDFAALKAAETLIKHKVCTAPVDPLAILKSLPNVVVVSFTEMADQTGLDRCDVTSMYGAENQDAVTYTTYVNGQTQFVVAFNLRMPYSMLQTALARELGHIVLKHDETIPEEVRTVEALYFVRHILCPRPLIHAIQASSAPLSIEVIGNVTGCYGRFLAGLRRTPGASVPGNINAQVEGQFSAYVNRITNIQYMMVPAFGAALADFGTYMDNYEE